ncbi:MAG: hypothetical protein ACYC0X_17690 [Pirellulaceae bacterium]
MKRFGSVFGFVLLIGGIAAATGESAAAVRLATFRCDVTPVLDGSFYGGWMQPLVSQEAPLWAKGVVLEDDRGRYVLCALDWCTLENSAHAMFCRKLAAATTTDVSRVAVQCVHQHTAPYVNADAQLLLNQQIQPPRFVNLGNLEEVADRLAVQVGAAIGTMQPVDRIGVGEAPVERVAANRRVIGPDGGIRVRWSTCADAELRAAPEGNIDSRIKTITLARGDEPRVRLHYYATHPQSGGGDGRVGIDFVGDAREQLEREEGVLQVYFTGCAGDITVGKYNDGSPSVRPELAGRLLAAMRASVASTSTAPLDSMTWETVALALPPQTISETLLEESRGVLADPGAAPRARLEAASRLAFHEATPRPILLSMLALGNVRILHLPGEPMLEFQLFAQRLLPERVVTVAGYGDGAPGYLCTEESFAQGGYEPTATAIAPHGETVLKRQIATLLQRLP